MHLTTDLRPVTNRSRNKFDLEMTVGTNRVPQKIRTGHAPHEDPVADAIAVLHVRVRTQTDDAGDPTHPAA